MQPSEGEKSSKIQVRAFYQVWTRKIRRVSSMLHCPKRYFKRLSAVTRGFFFCRAEAVRNVPFEHFARPSRRGY
jgi:hypothetical protein